MTKSEIESRICEIVQTYSQYDGDNIQLQGDLREDYGIDSISLVELLVDIESQFDITFDSSFLTYESFSTAGSIADYINEKLNG
ncbi:acyl carrier protein [Ruminiclostridium herbifermentans]|uniref:Acyl carrier protein n=1 Tax=Ruminiclostridium herbifermentans TaxID=2488810 RepID=A0A4U7JID8_9FIRM|nr:acyl carrier protein [Ruminiclostridium herbifermentans]QNU66702.1 acyl carrier protein [Ruminiclostridium herbifermentans]